MLECPPPSLPAVKTLTGSQTLKRQSCRQHWLTGHQTCAWMCLRLLCATRPGIVGCAGLQPTVAAIKAGKDICLANKETLIAGGPYVLPLAAQHGVHILPADSEHSAIFQCIQVCLRGR